MVKKVVFCYDLVTYKRCLLLTTKFDPKNVISCYVASRNYVVWTISACFCSTTEVLMDCEIDQHVFLITMVEFFHPDILVSILTVALCSPKVHKCISLRSLRFCLSLSSLKRT